MSGSNGTPADGALRELRSHLYSVLNDGESLDETTHQHAEDAFMLVGDLIEDGLEVPDDDDTVDETEVISGSFVDAELYPDRDVLHERIWEHAEEKYAPLPLVDFDDCELAYAAMEDGVVLYRIKHPTMGVLGEGLEYEVEIDA